MKLPRWLTRLLGEVPPETTEALALVEQAVEGVDRRLRLLPDYRKQLLPGARVARDFLHGLPGQMGAPLELSLAGFTADRRLGLFFSSPASLYAVLSRSHALSLFFSAAANGTEAHALLLMNRTEIQRFGMRCTRGGVETDVAQTVVSFDAHRLVLPCQDRASLLAAMPVRGAAVLIQSMSRRLQRLEHERLELELEETRISMRLAMLAMPGSKMVDALPQDGIDLPSDRAGLLVRQAEVKSRLDVLREKLELGGICSLLAHMLGHPADYFRLRQVTLCLNRMGVKLEEGDMEEAGDATRLDLEEVLPDEDAPPMSRVVVPVVIRLDAIRELQQQGFGDA